MRSVLHVDLDAFFVSVERVVDPSLRGRPVVVGGSPQGRGVVAAASYEARAYGVRSAMPMAQALRLCPDALRLPGRRDLYRRASRAVFALLAEHAPVIEKVSVDEAYLDLTGTERLLGAPMDAATRLQSAVRERLRLDLSVGIAANRLVSKVASGCAKPRGLCEVRRGRAAEFLAPLPVRVLPGVGPVGERRLAALGIRRLGRLAGADDAVLRRTLGEHGARLRRRARGEDDTPVRPGGRAAREPSLGHERTFAEDLRDPREMRAQLQRLLEQGCARLRERGSLARTIVVKLRRPDFETHTRDRTLAEPSDQESTWLPHAHALLARLVAEHGAARLLGVRFTKLSDAWRQPGLFDARGEAARRRTALRDRLRARYGEDAVRDGDLLDGDALSARRDRAPGRPPSAR